MLTYKTQISEGLSLKGHLEILFEISCLLFTWYLLNLSLGFKSSIESRVPPSPLHRDAQELKCSPRPVS